MVTFIKPTKSNTPIHVFLVSTSPSSILIKQVGYFLEENYLRKITRNPTLRVTTDCKLLSFVIAKTM